MIHKNLLCSVLVMLCCFTFSCQTTLIRYAGHPSKSLPPGQAKKLYGQQSARAFAPGQQKKGVIIYKPAGAGKSNKKK